MVGKFYHLREIKGILYIERGYKRELTENIVGKFYHYVKLKQILSIANFKVGKFYHFKQQLIYHFSFSRRKRNRCFHKLNF